MTTRSYSDFDTMARCPMAYKYRIIYNIQPKHKNATLHEGSVQHKVVEYFLLALQWVQHEGEGVTVYEALESMEQQAEDLKQEGANLRFPAEQLEFEELVDTCVRRTYRWVENHNYFEDWTVLHVEEQFAIELEGGLTVTCTPDFVIRDANRFVWVVDLKTAATVPDEFEPTLQTRINLAAVKAVYPEARGFIFDVMRKKEPREPSLIKDGSRISRIKDIDTDFRTLSDWIEHNKPELFKDPDTLARLAELKEDGDDKWFRRFQHYVDDTELEEALADVERQDKVLEFIEENDLWYRVYIKSGYRECARCSYRIICGTELRGQDTETVLEQFYEPRDTSYKEYDSDE